MNTRIVHIDKYMPPAPRNTSMSGKHVRKIDCLQSSGLFVIQIK